MAVEARPEARSRGGSGPGRGGGGGAHIRHAHTHTRGRIRPAHLRGGTRDGIPWTPAKFLLPLTAPRRKAPPTKAREEKGKKKNKKAQ